MNPFDPSNPIGWLLSLAMLYGIAFGIVGALVMAGVIN